jgi:hypothetical protein
VSNHELKKVRGNILIVILPLYPIFSFSRHYNFGSLSPTGLWTRSGLKRDEYYVKKG